MLPEGGEISGGDMGSLFHRVQSGCIFFLLIFAVSCSLQGLKKPEGEKEFFQETCRLERLTHNHPNVSVRAHSHLKLAFLYADYRNPQLNYTRALQEMEIYLSLAPADRQGEDFNNWLAVLREIGKLQKANKGLREEVGSLKETIDRLKSLDRQMEEKRRLTK